ncbi:MAG: hypothetical protein QOH17_1100, partial [Pseudonocardiales bacterium]|nr:hypothetical protein [Pseudonocardiales bacterium]
APLYTQISANRQTPVSAPFITSRFYPARRGFDDFYGYGRANIDKATSALLRSGPALVPPQVEITSPDWFSFVDPTKPTAAIGAQISARPGLSYKCKVFVAPGSYPEDNVPADADGGDFKQVPSDFCNGTTSHGTAFDGTVAQLSIAALKARFPSDPGAFDGPLPPAGTDVTGNGRPNKEPFGFAVKVVATVDEPTTDNAIPTTPVIGQDRRALYLHRDTAVLPGFPKKMTGDGQPSPLLADLDHDNRNELVYATGDGFVHAVRANGSELPGWPVRSDRFPYHDGSKAFTSGEVSNHFGGAIVGGLAAGDLHHDGSLEVLATDYEGNVYAWDAKGHLVFHTATNPNYSGHPLSPFVPARKGNTNRTQRGFLTAPVLADLNGDGRPEIIAAALDRHVYAWHDDGKLVAGFPVEVVDPSKVKSIDAKSHQVTFKDGEGATLGQGAIIDTPAVADITGDKRPEIIVGTNEEYDPAQDGGLNAGTESGPAFAAVGATGVISPANGRVFALKGTGGSYTSALLPHWPFKVARLAGELLPVVGEGIDGSPIIGPVDCGANGGSGPKAGVMPDAGIAYILDKNATSCQGKSPSNGMDNGLQTNGAQNPQNKDTPVIPAVGQPAFAPLGGKMSFIAPTTGVMRALDLAASEYQGGQDSITAWDASSGQFRTGFPAPVNDLQFLTGPVVGDITGGSGSEIIGGSASLDLNAFDESGQPVPGWPKLTTDWMIATPAIGSFGVRETDPGAHKAVFGATRSGYVLGYSTSAPACSPSPWPRFHHDLANSGDYSRDATPPGVPFDAKASGGRLTFRAPGDDLLCGKATRYQVAVADKPVDAAGLSHGTVVHGAPTPGAAGTSQSVALPAKGRYIGIRAVDDQGNLGPTVSVATGRPPLVIPLKPTVCVPRVARISSHGVGPVHLGDRLLTIEHRFGRPNHASRARIVYCVQRGGRVAVLLSSSQKATLAGSTAPGHVARGVHPGSSIRTLARVWKRTLHYVGRGVYVTGLRHRVVYGVRRGRVTYVAAADRSLLANRKRLFAALHSAGL